jgi:F-box/WD-40 domain protein 9
LNALTITLFEIFYNNIDAIKNRMFIAQISKESFPRSIYMQEEIVYVGDANAKLHILDPKQDFEPVKSYKTNHLKSITGIYVDSGCLITSSLDRTVQISSPTDPPQTLTSIQYSNGEIARVSVR